MWILAAIFTIGLLAWSAWQDARHAQLQFTDDEFEQFLRGLS